MIAATQVIIKFIKAPTDWRDTLTVAAAVASPVISLIVAGWVTWRTIRNDRQQRALDRAADRSQQVHDRQLTASADFAHAAHKARVAATRADPRSKPSEEVIAKTEEAVEAARLGLARVQLLFRPEQRDVRLSAESVVDSLTTAENAAREASEALRELNAADADRKRELLETQGKATAAYTTAMDEAANSYESFLAQTTAILNATAA